MKYRQLYLDERSAGSERRRIRSVESARRDTRGMTAEEERRQTAPDRSTSLSARQPHVARVSARDRRTATSWFEVRGQDVTCRHAESLEDERRGMRTTAWLAESVARDGQQHLATSAISTTFPCFPLNNVWDDTGTSELRRRESLRRPDQHQGHRALPPDDDGPRRPRPRPDVRQRHDGLRRGAVGPAVDHHRHVPRRAGAGPHPADGRPLPLLPARRLARGPQEAGRADRHADRPQRARPAARHAQGVRVPHRAARHPQEHRQQPRHQGGDDPRADRRGDRPARRHRDAVRPALRGQGHRAADRAVHRGEPVAAPQPARRADRRREPRPPRPRPPRPRTSAR